MKFFYLIFFIFLSFVSANERSLTISTGFNILEAHHLKAMLSEGFKRANIDLNFQYLPNQRSLINANTGVNDGEAARIWKISKIYPNLVGIKPEVYSIDIVILSKNKVDVKELSDLSKYNVGVVRGVKITEILAEKAKPKMIARTIDYKNLLKMLLDERIDVVIINKLGMYTDLSKMKNQTFYLKKTPLVSLKVYMHLNKKNSELTPIFEKAFKSMHDDGTYKKMTDTFLNEAKKAFDTSLRVIEYD